jgi:hypothetical protein
VPFAHEVKLTLKFAGGKLRGFKATARVPEAEPFFVAVTLPQAQPEGAGQAAALAA